MARNGRPRRPRAERGGSKPRRPKRSVTFRVKKHGHYVPVSTSMIKDIYGPAVERAISHAPWERQLDALEKGEIEPKGTWVKISDLPRSKYRVMEDVDGWRVYMDPSK